MVEVKVRDAKGRLHAMRAPAMVMFHRGDHVELKLCGQSVLTSTVSVGDVARVLLRAPRCGIATTLTEDDIAVVTENGYRIHRRDGETVNRMGG